MTYRGDILGRFDPHYYLPFFRETIDILAQSRFQIVKLKEVCWKITDGTHHTPEYMDHGVPFLSVKDVRENAVNFNDTKFISEVEHSILSRRCKPEPNDVLLTKIGTFGLAAVVPENVPEFSLFVSVALLKIIKTRANPYYVAYCLNTQYSRIQMNRFLKGIAQPDLHLEEIAKISILLPPLETQNYIVKIMQSAHTQKRQKEQEADAVLDSIDDYVLAELGIEIPTIEKKKFFVVRWDAVNGRLDPHFYLPRFEKLLAVLHQCPHEILGNIAELCHQKWSPEKHPEETFRYIEINGVSRDTGEVSFSEVPTKEAPNRAQMMVQKDDIIVSLTRPHHGSIALIDDDLDGCIISTGFAVLRKIKDPTLSRLYLYSVLRNKLCLHQMLQRSSGGSYPAITKDQLMQILLPIPSPNRQKEIVKELSRRSAKARRLREEATKEWEAAKAQVEEQLLTGEVY